MSFQEFPCPHCSARLRVRDRTWIGRTLDCPDCQRTLTVEVSDADKVVGRPLPLAKVAAKSVPRDRARKDRWTSFTTQCKQWLSKPLSILTALALAVVGLVMLMVLWSPTAPPNRQRRVREPAPIAIASHEENTDVLQPVAQPDPNPLPVAEPKEPEPNAEPPGKPQGPVVPAESQMPIIPELADDVPPIDIPKILNQAIIRYSQPRPVEAVVLLQQMEELIGLPIETTAIPPDRLKRPVTIELEATTLGDILKKIANSVGAEPRVERNRLKLVPLR